MSLCLNKSLESFLLHHQRVVDFGVVASEVFRRVARLVKRHDNLRSHRTMFLIHHHLQSTAISENPSPGERLNGMLQERQRREAQPEPLTNDAISPTPADDDAVINISGATKESLDVRPSQVIFATSEGNYVNIYYIIDDKPNNMLIRTSMKNVSELLCRQSYIMQCHRAYIVNLRHVAKVESRNSGIALVMQYGNDTVLVSKQYSAEVKERIKNPSTIA